MYSEKNSDIDPQDAQLLRYTEREPNRLKL